MSTKKNIKTRPTYDEMRGIFPDKIIGKPFKIKPRACRDVQDFIEKLNKIYADTEKSSIQFD